MGHEVTPHGHETVYSVRELKILVQDAGVTNPGDGNRHFMSAYWTQYFSELS